MEMIRQEDGVVQVLGELHISDAEEFRNMLLRELTAASTLVLDLSLVESCDTASFQLLCSLQKSAERDGKEVRISAQSAAMREGSAILGLSLGDLASVTSS